MRRYSLWVRRKIFKATALIRIRDYIGLGRKAIAVRDMESVAPRSYSFLFLLLLAMCFRSGLGSWISLSLWIAG